MAAAPGELPQLGKEDLERLVEPFERLGSHLLKNIEKLEARIACDQHMETWWLMQRVLQDRRTAPAARLREPPADGELYMGWLHFYLGQKRNEWFTFATHARMSRGGSAPRPRAPFHISAKHSRHALGGTACRANCGPHGGGAWVATPESVMEGKALAIFKALAAICFRPCVFNKFSHF